jgi:hypothetical protein
MADSNSLALLVKPPQFDLATPLLAASQIQNAQTNNTLAQLRLRQANRQQGALDAYRTSGNLQDLRGEPDIYAKYSEMADADQQRKYLGNARDAQALLAMKPEQRVQEWPTYLERARREGRIPEEQYQSLLREGPNELRLHGAIQMAMPLKDTEASKFQEIGETRDKYGQPQKHFGFVNGANQRVTPFEVAPADAGRAAIPQGVTGQAYLDALDLSTAAQVKAMIEGRMAPPSSFALAKPYWQQMLDHASSVQPGFDLTNWKARNETLTDFSKGKAAGNVKALNTVMGHLDSLDKSIDKLGNWNVPFGPAFREYIGNPIAGQVSPEFQANRADFETKKSAVASELMKVFRETGGSLTEVKDWESKLHASDSVPALKQTVRSAMELIGSRMNAVNDQWNRVMGGNRPVDAILSPAAKSIYQRLSGEGHGEAAPQKHDAGPLPRTQQPPEAAVGLMNQIRNGAQQVTLPSGKTLSAQEYVTFFNQKYGSAPAAPTSPYRAMESDSTFGVVPY